MEGERRESWKGVIIKESNDSTRHFLKTTFFFSIFFWLFSFVETSCPRLGWVCRWGVVGWSVSFWCDFLLSAELSPFMSFTVTCLYDFMILSNQQPNLIRTSSNGRIESLYSRVTF